MILQKWDPTYGGNDPTAEEYGPANGDTPLADAEELNYNRYDKFIRSKIIIDKKSNNFGNLATVIRRATDEYGVPIWKSHRNPILETFKFEVELENGDTDKIMSNQNAVNLYSNLENEGSEIFQFKGIIEHKKDGYALKK